MASRPRVTSTSRQRTTRGGPVVTSRSPQSTTGRGRIVRGPSLAQVFAPSWGRPVIAPKVGGLPLTGSSVAAVPATAAYSTSNLPPDASYDAQIAALQRQRDDQIAALTQARTSGLSDYGFTEGASGTLAFDPNNPYSKAALMKKTYDTNRRSTGQTLAAGGQLYSGAFQNAQDLVTRNQAQSEDSLQKALIGFLARNTQGATSARTGYETAASQAAADRIGRFQSNPLYDPAATAPDATAVAAAATPAAAASRAPAAAAAAMRRRRAMTGARIGRI